MSAMPVPPLARIFHLPGQHNQKLHGGHGDLGIGPLDGVDLVKGHAITTGKNKAELRAALVDAGLNETYLSGLSSKEQYEVLKRLKKTTPEDLAKAKGELHAGIGLTKAAPAKPEPASGDFDTTKLNPKTASATLKAFGEGLPGSLSAHASRVAAKKQIAAELGKRMSGDKAFQDYKAAKGFSSDDQAASHLVKIWSSTSADSHPESLGVQRAAGELFGVEPGHLASNFTSPDAQAAYAKHGGAYKTFVTAMHENTQAWFAERGITEVTVARGMQNRGYPSSPTKQKIQLQPLSSFALNPAETNQFGSHKVVMTVPVSKIVGTARTGHGCLPETEVTVIGGEYEAWTWQQTSGFTSWSAVGAKIPKEASEPLQFHLPGQHNQKLHGGRGDLGIGPLDNIDLAKGHAITTGKNKAELRAALVDAGVSESHLDGLSSKEQYEVLKSLKKTTPDDLAKAKNERGGGALPSVEEASARWYEASYGSMVKRASKGEALPDSMGDDLKAQVRADAEALQKAAESSKSGYNELYRGIALENEDDVHFLFPGNDGTYKIDSLSASTPDLDAANLYANPEDQGFDEGVSVVMVFRNKAGVTGYLRPETPDSPANSEVVLPRGATYRMTGKEEESYGGYSKWTVYFEAADE